MRLTSPSEAIVDPEDQRAVIDFLGSSAAHAGAPVERVDTHASMVFLAGPRARKLKRAVKYDYLDFSTPARRRAMCEAEVQVNRRTAPRLYHGVLAVTCEPDGSLAINGRGRPVDWLVEMARFDQEALFDRLAARGALDLALMPPLGEEIARFHEAAAPRQDHGGRAGMAWVIDGNAAAFPVIGAGILDPVVCDCLARAARAVLDRDAALLDDRRDRGLVRECHGDLHLRNIVLLDGRPTLFDAIEFNEEIACADVAYDLAFLLMDLWRRDLPRHANAVLNGYVTARPDVESLALLPLFLSCRAAVRAKTSATAARLQPEGVARTHLQEAARTYLRMADQLLHPSGPRLVAVGGLSGAGKSTLARGVAAWVGPVPGAITIRSDEVRKQLCGALPQTRLGADAYTPGLSRRVYETIAERARVILQTGHGVIADAVFAREGDREAIERVAESCGVPFLGLWLEAPASTLTARVAQRVADASDADEAVIQMQLAQGTGAIRWHHVDAASQPDDVLAVAKQLVAGRPGAPMPGNRGHHTG